MAKKRRKRVSGKRKGTKRKTSKRRKGRKKRGGHIPLAILKRRAAKLNAIVKKRGG